MLRLGIIGAENSHSYGIGRVCNLDKKVPLRATHIWGETPEAAADSADKAAIPHIVSDWREMLGQIDGVMIDHRDGCHHNEAARFFIENGVPTFVDKPITRDLAEAKALFRMAQKVGTPLCTFGLIPLQKSFRSFAARVTKAGSIQVMNTVGHADLNGPYGGIFFYGFHQVDAIVDLMGTEIEAVSLHDIGRNGIASLLFSGGRVATMSCLTEGVEFSWQVCAGNEVLTSSHQYDKSIYLASARAIHRFLERGEVLWSVPRMLAPIAILDALQKSLVSGVLERVSRF